MCDTLCVRTGAGMLFAKNSDRPPSEAQVLISHAGRPGAGTVATQYLRIGDTGASEIVASHPDWLWGAEHGVNEHGVAVGNERIWTVDDPRAQATGLLGMDLVRLALERARTADEARDTIARLLTEHGQGGSGEPGVDDPYFSSFLVADARGGWVIETSARTWAARPVGAGTSISNRVSLTTDWTLASPDVAPGTSFDAWRAPRVPTGIADHRLAATRACVASASSGAGGPARLVAALRDHGTGPWGAPGSEQGAPPPPPTGPGEDLRGITVCMHVRDFQATTASFVVDLRTGEWPRAWVCLGSPCVGVYVPCFPPQLPHQLADPAQWRRFARLRDRVDHDGSVLAAVRAALAPVEAALWSGADDAAGRGAGAIAAFTANAFAPVDRALTTLGV